MENERAEALADYVGKLRAELETKSRLLEKAQAEIERLNDAIHLSWICAECGGFAHSTDDCLDTGTTLVCEVCKGKTIVELHTGESYKKSNDMLLQVELAKKLAEAALSVLSPCDDSEQARGFCVGHGGCFRLPCEYAELRAAYDAFRGGSTLKRSCSEVHPGQDVYHPEGH